MRRIALKVEYDGTDLHGWQLQPRGRTVQGVLEQAVRCATGASGRVPVQGASRTDAGVHAAGQVAHFDTDSRLPPQTLVRAINYWLPHEVSTLEAAEADPRFHARESAASKLYRYRLISSREPRPLLERYCARVSVVLRLKAMQACARQLIGRHDFKSFTSAGSEVHSTERNVFRSTWQRTEAEVQFLIQADGFTYNMVRALVGSMLEAGRGRLAAEQFGRILQTRDRRAAGPTAPPHGLTLERVHYPPALDPFARSG